MNRRGFLRGIVGAVTAAALAPLTRLLPAPAPPIRSAVQYTLTGAVAMEHYVTAEGAAALRSASLEEWAERTMEAWVRAYEEARRDPTFQSAVRTAVNDFRQWRSKRG